VPLYHADPYAIPLPPGHRFPQGKSARLRARLVEAGVFEGADFAVAPAAADAELARVHCGEYLDKVRRGALSAAEQKAIGFPWSEPLVERSLRSAGATLAAARQALASGWSANLGGGTHHAFRARGEGFCVYNDCATAARAMQAEAGLARIAIVDCDVHQGNGTAAIFGGDASVFTFSIHAARNFPFVKEASDLDIELADGTGDDEYAWHLERGLDETLERSRPQLVFYLAGADPYEDDRLGRLRLTRRGIARRDEHVLATLHARAIPVVLAMAGGYARDIEDTVAIHASTLALAKRIFEA
jgi:acetoin utilization deacetylase AcuC-like enzyme